MFAQLVDRFGETLLKHAPYVRDDNTYFENQTERVKQITYARPIVAIVLTSLVLIAAIAVGIATALHGYNGLTLPNSFEWLTTLGDYNFIIVGVSAFISAIILVLASRELHSRRKEKNEILEADRADKLLQPEIKTLFKQVSEKDLIGFKLENRKFKIHNNIFYYRGETPLINASTRELAPKEQSFLTKYFESQGYSTP
jgi:hypothetical protein